MFHPDQTYRIGNGVPGGKLRPREWRPRSGPGPKVQWRQARRNSPGKKQSESEKKGPEGFTNRREKKKKKDAACGLWGRPFEGSSKKGGPLYIGTATTNGSRGGLQEKKK